MTEEADKVEISQKGYNALIDQVNTGRGLTPYTRHCDYCPHAESRFMSSARALEQKGTCNCGLAEAVLGAFGR